MRIQIYISTVLLLSCFVSSCRDFVEIDSPPTQIDTKTVYADDANAISAIRGIYTELMGSGGFLTISGGCIPVASALSADELNSYGPTTSEFETNNLLPISYQVNNNIWIPGFRFIFYANSVLEGVAASSTLSAGVKQQLKGEALFVRALCSFYLTNVFGKIPVVTTTDYRINNVIASSPQVDVYKQIVADLKEAQQLMAEEYVSSSNERVRPNRHTATALLARTYLYMRDWEHAEEEATKLIGNTSVYGLEPLDKAFLKESREAIWQLKSGDGISRNTNEANFFILFSTPIGVALSTQMLNAFESGDQRKLQWVGNYTNAAGSWYFPYKYKRFEVNVPATEYSIVFRLAEQYLIRAEARAQRGNLTGANSAASDLNTVRGRAGLGGTTAVTLPQMLAAIEHERQVELFTEYGHRWLDLKRMPGFTDPSKTRADEVLAPVKGANWQPTDVLYPIPQVEYNINPKLGQNAGYN